MTLNRFQALVLYHWSPDHPWSQHDTVPICCRSNTTQSREIARAICLIEGHPVHSGRLQRSTSQGVSIYSTSLANLPIHYLRCHYKVESYSIEVRFYNTKHQPEILHQFIIEFLQSHSSQIVVVVGRHSTASWKFHSCLLPQPDSSKGNARRYAGAGENLTWIQRRRWSWSEICVLDAMPFDTVLQVIASSIVRCITETKIQSLTRFDLQPYSSECQHAVSNVRTEF